jgi:ribosome-associated protein
MGDTASNRELALELGNLLTEHKAEETVVLDLGAAASWADYLVIATARSTVHAVGLVREVDAFLSARGIRPVNPHKKIAENGWQLVDCSTVVVHVMLQEQRDFYALEKLWFKAVALDPSETSAPRRSTAVAKTRRASSAGKTRPKASRKGSGEAHPSKSS